MRDSGLSGGHRPCTFVSKEVSGASAALESNQGSGLYALTPVSNSSGLEADLCGGPTWIEKKKAPSWPNRVRIRSYVRRALLVTGTSSRDQPSPRTQTIENSTRGNTRRDETPSASARTLSSTSSHFPPDANASSILAILRFAAPKLSAAWSFRSILE